MTGRVQHLGCGCLGVFGGVLGYAVVAGRPGDGDLETRNSQIPADVGVFGGVTQIEALSADFPSTYSVFGFLASRNVAA